MTKAVKKVLADPPEGKKWYRVISDGAIIDGKEYKAGDKVMLAIDQASALQDHDVRLSLLDEDADEAERVQADDQAADPA